MRGGEPGRKARGKKKAERQKERCSNTPELDESRISASGKYHVQLSVQLAEP